MLVHILDRKSGTLHLASGKEVVIPPAVISCAPKGRVLDTVRLYGRHKGLIGNADEVGEVEGVAA